MCDTDCSIPHIKTNSKLILKTYDKNLLQSNGHFRNCEIPIDGYFGKVASLDIGTKNFASIKATSEENKDSWRNNTEKMYFCALERAGK